MLRFGFKNQAQIEAHLKKMREVNERLLRVASKGRVIAVGEVENNLYGGHGLDTGNLKKSYERCSAVEQRGPGSYMIRVQTDVPYAEHVEYGTKYYAGAPHVRPGIAAAAPKIKELLEEEFKK